MRKACSQEAEDVLVQKVEVPEAVHVAGRWNVAHRVSLVGVRKAGQNVPRRGDGQKQQQSAKGLQRPPAPPVPAQQQQGNGRRGKEDGRNQALGQRSQRQRRPHAVKPNRPAALQPGDKAVKRQQQQKREQHLRNGEAREQKRPDGGEHPQRGIKRGSPPPCALCPQPRQTRAAQQGQRIGQVGGKRILAKDAVEAGLKPIGQWRLLKIANAVHLQRDPVAALRHVLRGLRVGGVGVVQQRRRKQRSKLHRGKNNCEEYPGSQCGRRRLRPIFCICFICHRG